MRIVDSRRRLVAVLSAVLVALTGVTVAGASPAYASHVSGRHWAHDGLSHSQIYFVDHTGSLWPVTTSTYKWNEAKGVDSYYVSSCPSSRLHCVDVREYNADDGNYGVTYLSWSGVHYTSVRVTLNNRNATNATQRRKTTCHELGHVLGLEHRTVSSSCLRSGNAVTLNISLVPDAHDFTALHDLYAHAN
ncbi:matrixin family metalloprotease [Micromonosporaceae bacterium Da 78-11]